MWGFARIKKKSEIQSAICRPILHFTDDMQATDGKIDFTDEIYATDKINEIDGMNTINREINFTDEMHAIEGKN